MRLVHGDVTALREAGVGSGFRSLLDTGTFHGLTDAQREAMGKEVSAVAAPDATVILDCFAPRRRGPLPRGASRADVERAFPGWGSPTSRWRTPSPTRSRGCSGSTSASTGCGGSEQSPVQFAGDAIARLRSGSSRSGTIRGDGMFAVLSWWAAGSQV